MGDFLCFSGTNFSIEKNCFLLLGINFCDFQEVAFCLELLFLSTNNRMQGNNMQMFNVQHINQSINGVPSDDPFLLSF